MTDPEIECDGCGKSAPKLWTDALAQKWMCRECWDSKKSREDVKVTDEAIGYLLTLVCRHRPKMPDTRDWAEADFWEAQIDKHDRLTRWLRDEFEARQATGPSDRRSSDINDTEHNVQAEAERLLVEIYSFEIKQGTEPEVAWEKARSQVGQTLSKAMTQAVQTQSEKLGVLEWVKGGIFSYQPYIPLQVTSYEANPRVRSHQEGEKIFKDSLAAGEPVDLDGKPLTEDQLIAIIEGRGDEIDLLREVIQEERESAVSLYTKLWEWCGERRKAGQEGCGGLCVECRNTFEMRERNESD